MNRLKVYSTSRVHIEQDKCGSGALRLVTNTAHTEFVACGPFFANRVKIEQKMGTFLHYFKC